MKIHEKIVNFFQSRVLVGILYGLGIVIILALVFSAGMSVGFRKASFGRSWGENYERNFGLMPRPGMMMQGRGFPNAHGAVGKIIKINLPNLIVADKDNTEKVIVLLNDTKIERMRALIKAEELKLNDFIVVIGSPNKEGQIDAKFIRVMPLGFESGPFENNSIR